MGAAYWHLAVDPAGKYRKAIKASACIQETEENSQSFRLHISSLSIHIKYKVGKFDSRKSQYWLKIFRCRHTHSRSGVFLSLQFDSLFEFFLNNNKKKDPAKGKETKQAQFLLYWSCWSRREERGKVSAKAAAQPSPASWWWWPPETSAAMVFIVLFDLLRWCEGLVWPICAAPVSLSNRATLSIAPEPHRYWELLAASTIYAYVCCALDSIVLDALPTISL